MTMARVSVRRRWLRRGVLLVSVVGIILTLSAQQIPQKNDEPVLALSHSYAGLAELVAEQ